MTAASATPAAGRIVKAKGTGHIDPLWLSLLAGTNVTISYGADAITISASGGGGGGGALVQTAQTVDTTARTTATGTMDDSGISAALGAVLGDAGNSVRIRCVIPCSQDIAGKPAFTIYRGATDLTPSGATALGATKIESVNGVACVVIEFDDAPGVTTIATYKLYFKASAGATLSIDPAKTACPCIMTLEEIDPTGGSGGGGAPSGPAGGDLAGTYPNPTLAAAPVLLSTATTKGDLLVASASAAIARLGVGADGDLLTSDSGAADGLSWQPPASGGGISVAILQDQKTSGTDGGTSVANAWTVHDLQTIVKDADSIITAALSSNEWQLDDGEYDVDASLSMYFGHHARARIYNVTDSVVEGLGPVTYTGDSAGGTAVPCSAAITVTGGPKLYRLEYYCKQACSGNGLGPNMGIGTEVYASITVRKIG